MSIADQHGQRKPAALWNSRGSVLALTLGAFVALTPNPAQAAHIRHGAEVVHGRTGRVTHTRWHGRINQSGWGVNSHWHGGDAWLSHSHWGAYSGSRWGWQGNRLWGSGLRGSSQLWSGGGEERLGNPMVPAGTNIDPVQAYQQWQAGVAEASDAKRTEAQARQEAEERIAQVQPAPERSVTLDAWQMLSADQIDWSAAREAFAERVGDANLAAGTRHEARLGFVLAAAVSGEVKAAVMSARRIDAGAGAITLEPGLALHVESARRAIVAARDDDRQAIETALGLLRVEHAKQRVERGTERGQVGGEDRSLTVAAR